MKRLTEEMDEKLPGLFEPNIVLPVQYFTRLQRGAVWTGEQRLMAAVLEDAVVVCSKRGAPKTSKGRQVLRETLRWLRSNDRTWTFSFLRICEHLDLSPSAIRRGIRILRGEQVPVPIGESRVTPDVTQMPDEAYPMKRAG
jgi:hypothetical protein